MSLRIKDYGKPWPPPEQRLISTQELGEEFTVHGFLAPYVVVTRKADNVKGTLEFTHHPRWYFGFVPDD